uniref:Uncharacterized protein n=1 Tax=Manihot esculenta TaxID=3983 RepID=A0A2C9VBR5_MANES
MNMINFRELELNWEWRGVGMLGGLIHSQRSNYFVGKINVY